MTKIPGQILVYGKYGHTSAKSATMESSCSPACGFTVHSTQMGLQRCWFSKKLVRCSSKAVPQPPQSSPVSHPHGEKSSVHHIPAIPACSDGFAGKAVCKLCVLVHLQLLCPQVPSLPCSAPGRAAVRTTTSPGLPRAPLPAVIRQGELPRSPPWQRSWGVSSLSIPVLAPH